MRLSRGRLGRDCGFLNAFRGGYLIATSHNIRTHQKQNGGNCVISHNSEIVARNPSTNPIG